MTEENSSKPSGVAADESDNGNEQPFIFGPQEALGHMDADAIVKRAELMFAEMDHDRPILDHYAEYARGNQSDPYIPNYADPTTRELAKRSTLNLMTLAINLPAQISYIDGYSRKNDLHPAEWQVWKDSNMDAKQTRVFVASLTYGQGFTMLSNMGTDKRRIDLLSSRDTIAFFEDAINDSVPAYALTIKSRPGKNKKPGLAVYADAEKVVYLDYDGKSFKIAPDGIRPHDLGMTPVVRWPAILDDRGYAKGVVEDLIPAQDRVNQTVYDGLLNQSFGAYGVRWAAGLVGEPVFLPDGSPKLDANGKQVYGPIPVSQSRMLTTDDPSAKFGTMNGTEQKGFIDALDSAIRSFAVTGQLPPHSLLGSMSNLSAETLQALMAQTERFTQMLKSSWGDAALTQMKMVALDMGITESETLRDCEVRWRDMRVNTITATVDALGKASQMLGIPGRGLWSWMPGATDSEISKWERLLDEERLDAVVGDPTSARAALNREATKADPAQQEAATPANDASETPSVPTPRDVLKSKLSSATTAGAAG